MKKILIISLAFLCLALVGQAQGAVDIASPDNAVIVGPHMGGEGITPVTEVIKVSTGTQTSASIGDVMVWDTTNAADGYHVKRCSADSKDGQVFAGVMVTATSRDTHYSYSAPKANGPTIGYMAIRGFVAAKIDTSSSTTGERLMLNGGTLAASFATAASSKVNALSQDIGVLLIDTATDGLMRVWLK